MASFSDIYFGMKHHVEEISSFLKVALWGRCPKTRDRSYRFRIWPDLTQKTSLAAAGKKKKKSINLRPEKNGGIFLFHSLMDLHMFPTKRSSKFNNTKLSISFCLSFFSFSVFENRICPYNFRPSDSVGGKGWHFSLVSFCIIYKFTEAVDVRYCSIPGITSASEISFCYLTLKAYFPQQQIVNVEPNVQKI